MPRSRTTSLKLDEGLYRRLADEAQRRGTTQSALLREAAEEYLAKRDVTKGSALDLMKDLVGKFAGPRDLSTNPKHMRGFGK